MNICWNELTTLFLRIGLLGFGGPQAHIAMMREEIVETRAWVSIEQFEEGLGLCETLPGPASSQMAIYLGWLRGGVLGGLISGICFLLPGLLIVLLLSELWRNGQAIPSFTTAIATLQPVIAAIIWAFAWKLMHQRKARWQRFTAGLVMLGVLLSMTAVLSMPAGLLLLLAGLARVVMQPPKSPPPQGSAESSAAVVAPWFMAIAPWGLTAHGLLSQLFGLFFQTGLLVFGGGLVIIPLLEQQVVQQGWLTAAQFLDGVAIGQISPGPVVLTSAFIGYQAGWIQGGAPMALSGGLVATVAMFLPSFLFILIGTPLLQRLRQQQRVKIFLGGLLAGVPGAVAATALSLTVTALQAGNIAIQLPLFTTSLWLSCRGQAKPLPLISAALLIGVILEQVS
ncbi:MAG: chromate efflux transporter [Synechococcus sp.]|nr:chromate efflux transporter [Synechococcus sp.]